MRSNHHVTRFTRTTRTGASPADRCRTGHGRKRDRPADRGQATEDNDKLFALQERVIASPAETLRGCVSKLRVIFDPNNGPCAAAIEAREFAAVAQVVEFIERTITPPPDNADAALFGVEQQIANLRAERAKLSDEEVNDDPLYDQMSDLDDMVLETPVQTMAGAVCVLRRLLDPNWGVNGDAGPRDLHRDAIRHVLAIFAEAAIYQPS